MLTCQAGCILGDLDAYVRKRGFIDYDSDAIRLRNPEALRKLT